MSETALFIHVDFEMGRVFANIWYLESRPSQNVKINKSMEYIPPDTIFLTRSISICPKPNFSTRLFLPPPPRWRKNSDLHENVLGDP